MRALVLLAAFAVVVPAVAALPAAPLPPPAGSPCPGEEGVPFEAIAEDGTALRGHLHLPETTPPYDIVLEVSPYFGTTPGGTVCPPEGPYAAPLRQAGFAFALASLRGTGESDGCLQFGGAVDVGDVGGIVRALAARPESTGRIAMVGGSFSAMAAVAGVASREPALRAVIVVSPVVDWWSVHTRGGAQWMPTRITPMPSSLAVASFVPGVGLNMFGVAGLWGPTLPPSVQPPPASHAACPLYAEHAREDALLWVGDRTPYWEARDHRPLLDGATTPVLLVNGLRNLEETIQQVNGLWELLDGEKRFVLGQWDHLGVPPGFDAEQANWLAHHLRGAPLVGGVGVRYQTSSAEWRVADRWPPSGDGVTLLLSGERLVPEGEPVEASARRFQSFQGNPCLGLCIAPPANFQPVCGPFQAAFVSPPLLHDVTLAGHYHARFTVTSDAPDGTIAAFLFASATGACPDPAERELRRAMGTLRHFRDESGADFPVDEPTAVELTSLPFAATARAGERLVLVIGGGAAPLAPRAHQPMLTISAGSDLVGELELAVVAGTLAFGT